MTKNRFQNQKKASFWLKMYKFWRKTMNFHWFWAFQMMPLSECFNGNFMKFEKDCQMSLTFWLFEQIPAKDSNPFNRFYMTLVNMNWLWFDQIKSKSNAHECLNGHVQQFAEWVQGNRMLWNAIKSREIGGGSCLQQEQILKPILI